MRKFTKYPSNYVKASSYSPTGAGNIVDVSPVQTGGGIYTFYGALDDGTYFITNTADTNKVYIVNRDPRVEYMKDGGLAADYPMWLNKHRLSTISGESPVHNFYAQMYDWIIANEPNDDVSSYRMEDIMTQREFLDPGVTASTSIKADSEYTSSNPLKVDCPRGPYYVWEEFGKFKGSVNNPDTFISDARKINTFDGFNSLDEVIDYVKKYF